LNRFSSLASNILIALLLSLSGCNSYVQRIVTQSLGRIGESVPAPPHMITTPILQNPTLAVSWVGHATVLIQIHNKIIITDPFLTNTMGFVAKRFVKAGLDPTLLTRLDATLISHIHFDHFDYGSLDMLPKNGILAVPEGAAEYTPDFGFKEVYEMKPWQVVEREGLRITAVPAQHFTGRYGIDAAWLGSLGYTGYVIEFEGVTVFFAGDTGYNPEIFKEIGKRFKVDLAIVPIAPGSSGGLGSRIHANPAGALMIYKDIGATYMMPMHFGTLFYGADANPNEPINRLRELAAKEGLTDKIVGLEIGEQRILY
jgi:L-ascorbate metabolism protein UlaG (beta-lactamase superfamily)